MRARPKPWLLKLWYQVEAAAARALFAMLAALPPQRASALGGRLGRTFGPLIPRTRVARRNLARAFPEKSREEIDTIIRGMWDNLGRTVFEYPHLDRFRNIDGDLVDVVGVEIFDHMRDDGQAGIMISAHLANWELMGLAAAARGAPLNLVYRAPNNPHMAWVFELRRSGGAEMVPKGPDGAKRLLKLLRSGAHLGMLVDQKMNDGIPVPFFGRDAMTAPAVAQLALRFRCPVIPARIERIEGVRFRITVFPPLDIVYSGNRSADERALMTRINAMIEGWIRERPEQWLWLHRRWPD
ncbi:MAG: lipid A biosynthesis lauroyl acyltransferase [Rhodospirillales bacterium]|nr:MAG: lipid A biosynthesis lauroyl acyltransferase [Rhodospirillales bacterium]